MDRRRVVAFGMIGTAVVAVFIVVLLPVTIEQNPAAASTRKAAPSTTTSLRSTTTTAPGEISVPIYEFTGSFVSTHCGSVALPRHYRGLAPGVPIAESLTSEECGIERDRRLFYAAVIGVGFLLIAIGLLLRRVRAIAFIAPPLGALAAVLALVGVVHRL